MKFCCCRVLLLLHKPVCFTSSSHMLVHSGLFFNFFLNQRYRLSLLGTLMTMSWNQGWNPQPYDHESDALTSAPQCPTSVSQYPMRARNLHPLIICYQRNWYSRNTSSVYPFIHEIMQHVSVLSHKGLMNRYHFRFFFFRSM